MSVLSKMPRGLSDEELDTYSRQIVLKDIGYEGQLKIRDAKACIVGVGGLGSTISTLLAGMGVGLLRIVDRDVVERANLHRQGIFDMDSIGMPKVEAAEKRIRAINPDVEVEALPVSVNEYNAEKIVEGMDVVLDGLDTIATRRHVNRACVELKKPYVFGAAVEMFGNVSTIIPGETPCLDCFLPSREPSATCATVGVHPSLVSIVASIQVSEAVKLITGAKPSLAGKLLFVDLRNMFFEAINIGRSDSCRTCGGTGPSSVETPVEKFKVEEVCSTRGLSHYVVSPNMVYELDFNRSLPSEPEGLVRIKARHRLGIVLLLRGSVEICLLKTGVGVIRGARNGFDALQSYTSVLNLFK